MTDISAPLESETVLPGLVLPETADHELAPFWEGTFAGELRVQRCDSCTRLRWPPRGACPACQGLGSTWEPVSTQGHLHTWTVVWNTGLPGFAERVPYAVGVIENDVPGVRMIGYIDADPSSLHIGDVMTVSFEAHGDVVLPFWRPAAASH